MTAKPVDVVRALAAALPEWIVTYHTIEDSVLGLRPVAIVIDDVGRESWVYLDVSIEADSTASADEVAQNIMDAGWS